MEQFYHYSSLNIYERKLATVSEHIVYEDIDRL